MKTKHLFTLMIITLVIISCKKDLPPEPIALVSKTTDLQVPQNFNWKTTRDVTLNISTQGAQMYDVISVFTSNPYSGSKANIKGSAKSGFPFNTMINIPTTVTELYIVKTSADGNTDMQKVSALQNTVNVVFANTKSSVSKSIPYIVNNGPGTSADIVVSQTSGSLQIKKGKTYIMNNNFNGSIEWQNNSSNQHSTLKINSNVTITFQDMGTNCKLEILPNAKLSVNGNLNMYDNASCYVYTNGEALINSINIQSAATKLSNYGTATISAWGGSITGFLENYAYMHILQATVTSSNSSIINKGDLILEHNFELNKDFSNYNLLHVKGSITANSIDIENHCKIVVDNDFTLNNTIVTSLLDGGTSIIVGNNLKGNSNSIVKLNNGSLILTKIMEFNSGNTIEGIGTTSSVRVSGSFNNMWGSIIKSNIEISGPSATAPSGMTLQNGAVYHSIATATNFIQTSDCNPGIGVVAIVDADNDGVTDILDDYPNDATKAYNNYVPDAVTYGTIMFEDLWPAKGDYDFNDMIVNYKINQITNASNKVVEVDASYKIKAIGGAISNGFGFRFDGLNPDQILSVTGTHLSTTNTISVASNGTENGQDKAVIILYDKTSHLIFPQGSAYVNTELGIPTINAYSFNVVIKLTSPVNAALLGTSPFNYFIFRTSARGHEIHALNKVPTSLANSALFSTLDDASSQGLSQYYRTSTNLPWAINVPVEIDYPSEKNDIVTVFTYFATWAQSGGTIKSDWYTDLSGYRNNPLIFHYSANGVK